MKLSIELCAALPRNDICRDIISIGRVAIVSSELFCRQFACRHYWTTCVVCRVECVLIMHLAESVWQQSVAVVNKFWKQKLINNFNYYLQHIVTKITLPW